MTQFGSVRHLRAPGMLALLAALSTAGSAHAALRQWEYTPGMSGITAINNEGGSFHNLRSQYDTSSRTLSWTAEFSDRITEGFTLVLSSGLSPQGRLGEFAIIYFDAAAVVNGLSSVPRMTAYTYNGRGTPDSWFTANGLGAPGDCIKSLWQSEWVLSSSASDAVLDGGVLGRRFSFTINASDLINHTPQIPGGVAQPWFGTGYGEQLGVWMFTAGVFDAEYGPTGRIVSLGTELRGNLLGGNMPTGGIPTPGAAALLAGGLIALARRRRG